MPNESTLTIESHRSAATLYATGVLTTAAVLNAAACVERLPEQVRALRVDLRGVKRTDSHALRTLAIALQDWRASRRGMSRVNLPDQADASMVAIRFAHQRWPAATSSHAAPVYPRVLWRSHDSRQGLVTRSLRERAGSETR